MLVVQSLEGVLTLGFGLDSDVCGIAMWNSDVEKVVKEYCIVHTGV